MDLFEQNRLQQQAKFAPLAEKLRPKHPEEVLGQSHLLGKEGILTKAIAAGDLPSALFYGPPGTGKTTIAQMVSHSLNMNFYKVSAVSAGIKDLREVVEQARENLRMNRGRSILFIDEIHRFSKSQQDFLLPYVEAGDVILIGATTENPFFSVNKALLSRLVLLEVKPLSTEALIELVERCRALYARERGVEVTVDPEAARFLAQRAQGDARRLMTSFALSALHASSPSGIDIGMEDVRDAAGDTPLRYDAGDDDHYDTISAFIKSMRGSDPDAAIFYLAKMLLAGEDPLFIARRMLIFASEDISNADPQALSVASSTFYACTVIGMPEVRIHLAQCAVYLALAEKSNATYTAIGNAMRFIREHGAFQVPDHLRDASYSGAEALGVGGYRYPHSDPRGWVEQRYLPEGVEETFFRSKGVGYEKVLDEAFSKRMRGDLPAES